MKERRTDKQSGRRLPTLSQDDEGGVEGAEVKNVLCMM